MATILPNILTLFHLILLTFSFSNGFNNAIVSILHPISSSWYLTYVKEKLATVIKYIGARGVMVIVTGYGHGDTSSVPGQD